MRQRSRRLWERKFPADEPLAEGHRQRGGPAADSTKDDSGFQVDRLGDAARPGREQRDSAIAVGHGVDRLLELLRGIGDPVANATWG
jgi:hypothetical protein